MHLKQRLSKWLLFVLLLILSHSAFAQKAEDLVERTKLYNEPIWLKLLHFKDGQSDIVSEPFFLSKDGRNSPKSELIATIKQFILPEKTEVRHAQCRFPARYLWLKEKLKASIHFDTVSCPDFNHWQSETGTDSISVVFASGYLENPASLYGHLMLKFNDEKRTNPLLDKSLNYGAETPKNENPISYILKGIFGGYQGVFSQAEFYKNNMLYGEMELRDLWEYRLNLSADDAALVRAHAYELLNTRFQYFFFKENCAMQIADIVGLVEEETLYNDSIPWVIPVDVIEHLTQLNLISEVNEFPSRQSRFYEKYSRLAVDEKATLKGFLENQDFKTVESIKDSNIKQLLLDAALDFYAYEYVLTDDKKNYDAKKYPLLAYQSDLPMVKLPKMHSMSKQPQQSTKPMLLSVGTVFGDSTALAYRFRAAYFDGLNLNYGKPKYATLSMFDLSVFQSKDQIKVKHLDLVKVESIQPSITGIEADKGSTWNFNIGYESNDYGQGGFLKVGKGISYQLNNDILAVAMLNVKGTTSNEKGAIMPQLRVTSNSSKSYAYSAQLEYSQHVKDEYNRLISQIEVRLFRNRSRELAIRFENDKIFTTSIYYQWYL